jgi:hypothetical protein
MDGLSVTPRGKKITDVRWSERTRDEAVQILLVTEELTMEETTKIRVKQGQKEEMDGRAKKRNKVTMRCEMQAIP